MAPIGPTAEQIFWGINHYISQNPDLAAKIQTTFQFKVTGPDSACFIDLKNGKGSATMGTGEKPDVMPNF